MTVKKSEKKAQIHQELSQLAPQIRRVMRLIVEAEDSWTEHYNRRLPDDMYQRRIHETIADRMDEIVSLVQQMNAEIVDQGIIHHNSAGRYELPSGHYYTSGSSIEFLAPVFPGDPPEWQYSSVEHNGQDYYIVSAPKLPMDGLRVRVKKSR